MISEELQEIIYCSFDPASPGPYEQYLLPHVAAEARREPERFVALGAAWRQYAVGAAVISFREAEDPGGAALESLFVDPLARGRGVGTELLRMAAAEAAKRGAETLTLDYILAGEELETFDAIVRKLGGEPEFYLPVYTMDISQFHDAPLVGRAFRPDYRMPEDVLRFIDLTLEQLEALDADPEVPWYVHPRERVRMLPELSLAYVQDGRVSGFWLGSISSPGNYSVQGVWRSASASVTTFHTLIAAHLNLCYYHGGGDFLYHCSPAVEFADKLIQKYSGGNYKKLEEHQAVIQLEKRHGETI